MWSRCVERAYPVLQFQPNGEPIPHLREVLDILHEGIDARGPGRPGSALSGPTSSAAGLRTSGWRAEETPSSYSRRRAAPPPGWRGSACWTLPADAFTGPGC